MTNLNETHDPSLKSWLASANEPSIGFPVQHLPFAVFRRTASREPFRPGVALGDQIIDLAQLASLKPFSGLAAEALNTCNAPTLNALMALGQSHWSALRLALSRGARDHSPSQATLEQVLVPQAQAEYSLPAQIRDYTDFYISIHHATAGGKISRPDAPLLPNFKWLPIGYHGRASSVVISGHAVVRPVGQSRPAQSGQMPRFGPSQRLDFELEMAMFVGRGNAQGKRITIDEADQHIFGLCILNDWSARDIQAWEVQPLGPFLAKSFATTISPWIVTREALEPFRLPFSRPDSDPQPLPYLMNESVKQGGVYDIGLKALISTDHSRAAQHAPALLAHSNLCHAYWTLSQLITHHTVNGCNLQPGDLIGTGTMSGPHPDQALSFNELSVGATQAVKLPWGQERMFLEDGDEITLQAECVKPGYPRLSFGQATGKILPAV
ncbi:MAG: fumarylacetoacetase [Alcaligenaceae bacterium]|nr:MAG: fumarylacetoacetase [Alcaligenaceae bacterium]